MQKTALTMIREACEELCDRYCKYPDIYKENYKDVDEAFCKMLEEKCEHCPLNRIGE